MSALTVRGEVELKRADGSLHVLKLGTAAICAFEQATGKSVLVMLEETQTKKFSLLDIREFVKCSTVRATPFTEAEANDLIDEVGVLPLVDALTDSIVAAFSAHTKQKKGNGAAAANPPRPARKPRIAGAGSSSTPPK